MSFESDHAHIHKDRPLQCRYRSIVYKLNAQELKTNALIMIQIKIGDKCDVYNSLKYPGM